MCDPVVSLTGLDFVVLSPWLVCVQAEKARKAEAAAMATAGRLDKLDFALSVAGLPKLAELRTKYGFLKQQNVFVVELPEFLGEFVSPSIKMPYSIPEAVERAHKMTSTRRTVDEIMMIQRERERQVAEARAAQQRAAAEAQSMLALQQRAGVLVLMHLCR